jgi:hypothetical protein
MLTPIIGVNFLIPPLDAVLTEITNEAIGSATPRHINRQRILAGWASCRRCATRVWRAARPWRGRSRPGPDHPGYW